MRKILFLLLLLNPGWLRAVDIDVVSAAVLSSGTSHNTSAFTIAANSNRLLIVTTSAPDTSDLITDCFWDSAGANEALTKLDTISNANGVTVSIWYKRNPTAATSKVVTCSASSSREREIGALSLYTADQGTTFRSTVPELANNGTNSNTVTVTDSAAGDLVIDNLAVTRGGAPNITTLTPSGSQTERWDISMGATPNDSQRTGATTLVASGADTEMTQTYDQNGSAAHIACAVITATATVRRNRGLLGVGQ